MTLTNPRFMKKIIDNNKKQRAIFTLEVTLGRLKNDGLPRNSIGATLICYSTGIDEEEAVREAVATLKRSNTVSYTHLRAHETKTDLVCRLLL